MTETQQFCTFKVDDFYFGVEVDKVQEVLRSQEMTRVPLAAPVVSGLINLRGQIVTAICLRRRLALGERSGKRPPMSVIVRTDEGAISLLVDEIGEVLTVSGDAAESPPDTLDAAGRELITRVYKLPNRLLLILDTDKAVSIGTGTGRRGVGVGEDGNPATLPAGKQTNG